MKNPNAQFALLTVGLVLAGGLARLPAQPANGEAKSPAPAVPADLARTPPMGWNSWNRFHTYINDKLIRAEARAMVTSGMKAAGYTYVVMDGGWEGWHDARGVFHPDPQTFPDMKALCDFIHGLGLKVGIHDSPGPKTCAGREASYGHEKQDAATFASWGIDFIKYDWCTGNRVYQPEQMQAAYREMAADLRATGRPILYSICQYGQQDVWKWGASAGGQMWRTTRDILNHYPRMLLIGLSQNGLESYAGPGHWNDPEMLEIGNGGMTAREDRTQMSLWVLLAAPLFAGNDLMEMNSTTLEILTNPEVIAVDQDPAGIQGHLVAQEGPLLSEGVLNPAEVLDDMPAVISCVVARQRQLQVWMKPLADGSRAVGLFNTGDSPAAMTVNFEVLGLGGRAAVRDLWKRTDEGNFDRSYTAQVPRHGSVLLKIKSVRAASQ